MELIRKWIGGLDHPISKSLSLVAELHRHTLSC